MKYDKKTIVMLLFCIPFFVYGLDGSDIMKLVDDKEEPETTHTLLKLELIDSDGSVSERIIEQWSRTEEDRDASVIVFHSPASVKNSRFLILSGDGADDAKYIFLPALKKVRRIPGLLTLLLQL